MIIIILSTHVYICLLVFKRLHVNSYQKEKRRNEDDASYFCEIAPNFL